MIECVHFEKCGADIPVREEPQSLLPLARVSIDCCHLQPARRTIAFGTLIPAGGRAQ